MALVALSNIGTTPFERLLGHVPKVMKKWNDLEVAFFKNSAFSADFLEQVRRALAFSNQCKYCMAKAGPPDENPEDIRLILALKLANQFAIAHTSIDEQDIDEFKKYFSDIELVELVAFCSFISASQRFGAVLGLRETESEPRQLK
jgi:alkylhydroperoxidase family enzyme